MYLAAGAVSQQAIQEATKAIVDAFGSAFELRADELEDYVRSALAISFPEEEGGERVERVVNREAEFEREFVRKKLERLRRDLPVALALANPQQRAEAVRRILARERRYDNMRQEATVNRAHARLELEHLRELSPQGAYWHMSPYVREHTLDCIAMGDKFWPWDVLDSIHPPLHHGCACTLFGFTEALERGFIRGEQDIPQSRQAVERALQAYRRARRMMEAAPQQSERLGRQLQEARRVTVGRGRGRRHQLRYPKGTTKGGQFMRRGDVAPRVSQPQMAHLRRAIKVAVETKAEGPPMLKYHSPEAVKAAAEAEGFVDAAETFGASDDGAIRLIQPESGAIMVLHAKVKYPNAAIPQMRAAHVSEVDWVPPGPAWTPPAPKLLDRPPKNFEEFKSDMLSLGRDLAERYDAPLVQSPYIEVVPGKADHSGSHGFKGDISLGREVPNAFEPGVMEDAHVADEYKKRLVWKSYKVAAHEVLHGVNPAGDKVYNSGRGDKALEEALTEEMARPVAMDWLRHQDRQDVIDWVHSRPADDPSVFGSYGLARNALNLALDDAGITDKRQAIEDLKFRVPPSDRFKWLAERARENGIGGTEGAYRERMRDAKTLSDNVDILGVPQEPGAPWRRRAPGEYERGDWQISRINYGHGDEWTAHNNADGGVLDPLPTLADAKAAVDDAERWNAANAEHREAFDPAKVDGFEKSFEDFHAAGMHTYVKNAEWRGGWFEVTGNIVDDNTDEVVGWFERTFSPERNQVEHQLMHVDASHQGKGFGSAFVKHSFDEYRKLGIDSVGVSAGSAEGGYAWAKVGFSFTSSWDNPYKDRGQRAARAWQARRLFDTRTSEAGSTPHPAFLTDDQLVLKHMRSRMAIPDEVTDDDLREFVANFATNEEIERGDLDGKFTEEWQIAMYGHDRPWVPADGSGKLMWLGKAFMEGSTWEGEYDLRTAYDDFWSDLLDPPKMPPTHPHSFPTGLKLAPEVEKIATGDDAKAYLAKLGVELRPGSKMTDNAHFWQEISQAVTDSKAKFPWMFNGDRDAHHLAGVAMRSEVQDKMQVQFPWANTWAITADDPTKGTDMTVGTERLDPDTWVTINDELGLGDVYGTDDDAASVALEGDASYPTRWAYGRMMHELGHVASMSGGVAFGYGPDAPSAGGEADVLIDAKINPPDIEKFSEYGAGNPAEAFAELFALAHTPGAEEKMSPSDKALLTKWRRKINELLGFEVM